MNTYQKCRETMRYRSEEQMEIVPEIEREREGERGGGKRGRKDQPCIATGKCKI